MTQHIHNKSLLKFLTNFRFDLFRVFLITYISLWVLFFVNQISSVSPESFNREFEKELVSYTAVYEQVVLDYQNGQDILSRLHDDVSFYVFNNSVVSYWSRAVHVPSYYEVKGNFLHKLIINDHGKFLVTKIQSTSDERNGFEFVFLRQLEFDYPVGNQYLSRGINFEILPYQIYQVGDIKEYDHVFTFENEPIFSFSFHDRQPIIPLWLTSSLIALLGFIVLRFCSRWSNPFYRLAIALVCLGSIYTIHHHLGFFWTKYPELNAGIDWVRGLSVLRLLVVVYFLVISILVFWNPTFNKGIDRSKESITIFDYIVAAVFCVFSFLTFFLVISFAEKVLDLQFLAVDVTYSWSDFTMPLSFLIGWLLMFLFFFLINQILVQESWRAVRDKRKMFLVMIAAYAVMVLSGSGVGVEVKLTFTFLLTFNLVNIAFDLSHCLNKLNQKTLAYIFLTLVLSALTHSQLVYKSYEEHILSDKLRFAQELLIDEDLNAENYLSRLSEKMSNDQFIISRMLTPNQSKEIVKRRIERAYLSSQLAQYDIRTHIFYPNGLSALPNDSITYDLLQRKYATEDNITDCDNVYLKNDSRHSGVKNYAAFVPVFRYDSLIGRFVFELNLRREQSTTVLPGLLQESAWSSNEVSRSYDYALYHKKELQYSRGSFQYDRFFEPDWLGASKLFEKGIEVGNYHHLAVDAVGNKAVIITSETYDNYRFIYNFSFMLALLVLMSSLFFVLMSYFNKRSTRFNLSIRIQLFTGSIMLVALFVFTIATINYARSNFIYRLNDQNIEKAAHFSRMLADKVQKSLEGNIQLEELGQQVSQIARNAHVDINLFDPQGKLMTTSLEAFFERGLHSRYMSAEAVEEMISEMKRHTIIPQKVGEFTYNSTFAAIRSHDNGKLLAILEMPFFTANKELNQQETMIFNNAVTIFTLVLIISFMFSYLAGRFIARPIELLTQKLSRTTLHGRNEPIEWKRDDEIGQLISEYNQMINTLESNKLELAKNQRESAWREIAKQVAHEIKNPLTPMKLSLQHLARTLGENSNEEIQGRFNSLIRQIDTLSDIVNSFSSFARMPVPEMEPLVLNEVCKETASIFESEHNFFRAAIDDQELKVLGDSKLLGRIIANLVLNALQSVPEGRRPEAVLSLSPEGLKARIMVCDNGSGIPPDIREKIFVPNFSTKKEGSGIGLAVCKRGVELMQGTIWFETKESIGTTFYLEFPLIP